MFENEFMRKISEIVGRHPMTCYSIQLEDCHVPYMPAETDVHHSTYCAVWREYSYALFNSIRLMIRYEKSLMAWQRLVEGLDGEIRDTLVMDYVQPTFRAICDIPNTFKDQLVRAVVKLEHLAKDDYSIITVAVADKPERVSWYHKLGKGDGSVLAERIRRVIKSELFEQQDAEHFRVLHGSATHDSSANLVEGKTTDIVLDSSGVMSRIYEPPYDLKRELKAINRQRTVLQDAYELFDAYAKELYKRLCGEDQLNDKLTF